MKRIQRLWEQAGKAVETWKNRGLIAFPQAHYAKANRGQVEITNQATLNKGRLSGVRGVRLFASPTLEERTEQGQELGVLDKRYNWDFMEVLKGKLGNFEVHNTTAHAIKDGKKIKFQCALVEEIQERAAYYQLPSRQRNRFKRWYDPVLDLVETQAREQGIHMVAIPTKQTIAGYVRRHANVADKVVDQFYERFPSRRGYVTKTLLINNLPQEYWVKELV